MRVLVLGGNGFIGSHLVDRLVALGWDVVVLDIHERRFDAIPPKVHFIRGDLSQSYLLREALIGIDVVFHLAWTTIHEVSNQDPAADIYTNLIPSIYLMDSCYRAGIKKLVFTSSGGTVYGLTREMPLSENHPQNPITSYGITKLTVEKYLHMFNHLYGLDYAILRPSVPFGPRQNPLGKQGAVTIFLYRVAKGLPVIIYGDGSVTRDFFYITDLVDALIACTQRELTDQRVFNIGGVAEISLIQLLDQIERMLGKKADLVFMPAREFDVPRIFLDTQIAHRELRWMPKVSIEQGLKWTWNWLEKYIQ